MLIDLSTNLPDPDIRLLYLDPATGGILFTALMGITSTIFILAKQSVHYLKNTFYLLTTGKVQRTEKIETDITFFGEGRQYNDTFLPIAEELKKRCIKTSYITCDQNDPLLKSDLFELTTCIGKSHSAWAKMGQLKTKVCVMTTPGLDTMQLKRSKNTDHYVYVVHSPTDKSFNKPYSFDYFDSICVSGPQQIKTIRFLEKLRSTPTKQLVQSGCLYYDVMIKKYRDQKLKRRRIENGNSKDIKHRICVLVAPTWGRNNLLQRYGERLLSILSDNDFEITIRPHPQSLIVEQELILNLQGKTKNKQNIFWDFDSDPIHSIANADILISDISGIIFDYIFLTGNPVLTIDFDIDKRGFEAYDLNYEPWELEVIEKIGQKINSEEIDRLPEIVNQYVGSTEFRKCIKTLKENSLYEFGNAAPYVADHLENLLCYKKKKIESSNS